MFFSFKIKSKLDCKNLILEPCCIDRVANLISLKISVGESAESHFFEMDGSQSPFYLPETPSIISFFFGFHLIIK
jgi:hypothetical protein